MNFRIPFFPSASSAKSAVHSLVAAELEPVVTANLQRASRLRQSILQKAFTGKLLTADGADNTDKK